MKIPLYQVDAFAEKLFSGNPAAVCPLTKWLPDDLMQNIAAENNLAETAFFVPDGKGFHIRWFTPKAEVDLCGHATLATAHVIFNYLGFKEKFITFQSKSGLLKVRQEMEELTLDFPADKLEKTNLPSSLENAFNLKPVEIYKGSMDYLFVFEKQKQIEEIIPDFPIIAQSGTRGIIITARGTKVDFVSRYFAPQYGIPEDLVTGSAHTVLTPYWAKKLGKKELTAIQLSERKGYLRCKHNGERVDISGKAITYLVGEIEV